MNSEYQALLATLREEEGHVVDAWLDEAQLGEPGATYQQTREEIIRASSRTCWSSPRPWSSCGTACSRCR
jgi:hypothetical protein